MSACGMRNVGTNLALQEHTDELRMLLQASDGALATIVQNRLPAASFTTVNVVTIRGYDFLGTKMDARLISLSVTRQEYFAAFFAAVFKGIGLISAQDLEGRVNANNLQRELIEHMCDSPNSTQEIEKAYARCSDIDFFIAQNAQAMEMKIRENSVILATYHITRCATNILPRLIEAYINREQHHTKSP